ncbi:MAG: DUF2399 domain-containing protein [Bifidobacteriaceae bacterium]|nr:DUF2399 domain-containing protein [Bifidobacteriaceae bacterium]
MAPALPGGVIFASENPSVVETIAAAARAAPERRDLAPLVCTAGQANSAVIALLERLASQGARVCYHGDFDWAGLRIAASLAARIDWLPWEFGAGEYRAAVSAARASGAAVPLRGAPAASPWDPDLAVAMAQANLAIEEEAVLVPLLRSYLHP